MSILSLIDMYCKLLLTFQSTTFQTSITLIAKFTPRAISQNANINTVSMHVLSILYILMLIYIAMRPAYQILSNKNCIMMYLSWIYRTIKSNLQIVFPIIIIFDFQLQHQKNMTHSLTRRMTFTDRYEIAAVICQLV